MRQRVRSGFFIVCLIVALGTITAQAGPSLQGDCPGNRVANPSFEEGSYKTEGLGTSLSSAIGNAWLPWSILGDATFNREVEYKVEDTSMTQAFYRVRSGRYSQKFFTTWGTHTAGFYQRIQVPRGSLVTFSIWVQIYTGEREITSAGAFISDLEGGEAGKAGPGNYRVSVGIDPYGDVPPAFGAPPSPRTVWCNPVLDRETRRTRPDGSAYDAFVQLSVSAVAQSDHVTIFTKGQPEYPVKHNDSFWDDACVTVRPPTPTPVPPTPTPRPPTATPIPPTPTPTPTALPPTATPLPPTATPVPPTATPAPTLVPPTPAPTQPPLAAQRAGNGGNGLLLPGAGVVVVVLGVVAVRYGLRRAGR